MEIASSILSKLGFDWQVALANLVNFLIVYFLLKKVVFNKIRDAILERKAKAQEGVHLREEADRLRREAEEMKESVKKEVAQERKEMLERVNKEKNLLLEKTNKEVAELKQKAHTESVKEKERIVSEAEGDILALSKNLARKVLEVYQEEPNVEKIETLTKQVINK